MLDIKTIFDKSFGLHRVFETDAAVPHVFGIVTLIIMLNAYLYSVGENNEIKFGLLLFLLLLTELIGSLYDLKCNKVSVPCTKFRRILGEFFRVSFLWIIPVLSMNQGFRSDLSYNLLLFSLGLPIIYVMPLIKTLFGKNRIYILVLKLSMLLNIIISIRTTLYGMMTCMAILASWTLKSTTKHPQTAALRTITAVLVYVTLINVTIPKCPDYCPYTCDPCAPCPPDAYSYFRTFWPAQRDYYCY